jgi:hypothetical protein
MPRSLVHLLLSLLLLVSQQLSLGHGYTHWREGSGAPLAQAERGTPGKPAKPALHDLCGQCATSATISFALPPTIRRFVPAELTYGAPNVETGHGVRLLATSAFQPRGPPRA